VDRKPPEVARMRMDSDSENVCDRRRAELYVLYVSHRSPPRPDGRCHADEGRSSATHSTWWVIGKTLMVLSLAAILCARRRSGGERSP
jgi:hypothetical protein